MGQKKELIGMEIANAISKYLIAHISAISLADSLYFQEIFIKDKICLGLFFWWIFTVDMVPTKPGRYYYTKIEPQKIHLTG